MAAEKQRKESVTTGSLLAVIRVIQGAGQPLFVTDLRPATAVFVRLTGLDYDQDDHAVATLAALVSRAQQALQRHGGVLLELTIGDKGSYLYGSFGAARVHEDDPARALRVQTYALAGTLVARGLGYAFLDSFTAAALDPERVVLLRLAPRVTFDLCMLCSAAAPRSVLVGRLENSLQAAVRVLTSRLEGRLSERVVCLG